MKRTVREIKIFFWVSGVVGRDFIIICTLFFPRIAQKKVLYQTINHAKKLQAETYICHSDQNLYLYAIFL